MSKRFSTWIFMLALGITSLCYTFSTVWKGKTLKTFQSPNSLSASIRSSQGPTVYQLAVEELNSIIYSRRQLQGSSKKSDDLYIEEIFIALKTTRKALSTRVKILMETWIPQANGSVYVMSNGRDENISKAFGDLYIDTGCGSNHLKEDMLCKLQSIYNKYMEMESRYKWLCTVDDDTYVNVPRFVQMLRNYNHSQRLLIGKPRFPEKLNKIFLIINGTKTKMKYWFPTGSAGVCFSRGLASQMLPICGGKKFIDRGQEISAPADATIGYVCDYLLKAPFIMKEEFHSHFEHLALMHPVTYNKQVTFGYYIKVEEAYRDPNYLLSRGEIPEFSLSDDPTRYLTLHCYLFPSSEQCSKIKEKYGPLKMYVRGAISQQHRFPS